MNRSKLLLNLLIALLAGPFGASLTHAADSSAERKQLQQQRRSIEAHFAQQSQACGQQFQVNTCMSGIRAERLAALKPIQAREQALDEQDRRARSEAQTQRVAERQREFEAEEGRRRTEALQARPATPRSGPDGKPGPLTSPHAPPVDPEVHARDITRQQQDAALTAAQGKEQLQRRQRVVLQHQQDFQRLQDQHEAAPGRKPAGKPLPIPSAADIAKATAAATASSAASSPRR